MSDWRLNKVNFFLNDYGSDDDDAETMFVLHF